MSKLNYMFPSAGEWQKIQQADGSAPIERYQSQTLLPPRKQLYQPPLQSISVVPKKVNHPGHERATSLEIVEQQSEFGKNVKVFDDMTDVQSQVSRGKSVHSKNTRKVK